VFWEEGDRPSFSTGRRVFIDVLCHRKSPTFCSLGCFGHSSFLPKYQISWSSWPFWSPFLLVLWVILLKTCQHPWCCPRTHCHPCWSWSFLFPISLIVISSLLLPPSGFPQVCSSSSWGLQFEAERVSLRTSVLLLFQALLPQVTALAARYKHCNAFFSPSSNTLLLSLMFLGNINAVHCLIYKYSCIS
jgi:hypothetical protein